MEQINLNVEDIKQQIVEQTKKNEETDNTPKLNRAQRRKQAKLQKKFEAKRMRMLENYIKKHPEAIKYDLDEEAIAKVEAEEKAKAEELVTTEE